MGDIFDKGGGDTKVVQDNEPPKWARPLYTQSADVAKDLFNSGAGFNIWPGSTVAEPSEMTRLGSQGLINTALSPDSYSLAQNPVNLTNQVVSQGGLMAPAQQAMDFFGDVTGGGMSPSTDPFYTAMNAAYNPSTLQATNIYGQAGGGQFNTDTGGHYQALGQRALGQQPGDDVLGQVAGGQMQVGTAQGLDSLRRQAGLAGSRRADRRFGDFASGDAGIETGQHWGDIYGRAQQPGAAQDYLTATARGDYLAEGNPYFRELLDKEAADLGDQIGGMFSSAGRYGSGAHQGVVGDTVGDFMLKGLGQDFARERGLQMDAAGMIENAQQGRLGHQMGAMQGLTGVQGQNIANQMAASQALQGADERAIGAQAGLLGQKAGIQQQNIANRLGAAGQMNQDQLNRISQALSATQGLQSADQQNAATQLQGAQGLGGMGQNLFQNLLSGAQNTFGAERANLADQMEGAQAGANISNQGLQNALGYMGALPTVQQNRTFAPNMLRQAGAQEDQYNQSLVNDMVRRFYEQDMQPWTRLGALQSAAQGAAGGYGKMHQMTSAPSGNNPLGFFGNVLSVIGGMPGF